MNIQAPLRISLLLSGLGIVILNHMIMQSLPMAQRSEIVWLFLPGIVLFSIAARNVLSGNENLSRVEQLIHRLANRFSIDDWQAPLLLISPFLSWMAWYAAGEARLMISGGLAVLAWFLAIATVIAGNCRVPWHEIKFKPRRLIFPLILIMTAFLIRGLAMDGIPIALTGDEGSAGIAAVQFITGEVNNPFISTSFSFPSLFYFLQSLSIRIFGQTTYALRFPSALAGALTVGVVLLVGSVMFDRRSGLLAAIFLAAYHFHVHFSRIGLNNIWDGLWYTIFIGALWYGWEYENNGSFTLAGLTLGIAQYFYPSGRALIIPILGWLFLIRLLHSDKFKRISFGILIMFIVAAVIILPLAIYYVHHPNEYMAPFARVTIFGPVLEDLVQSTGQPAWLILLKQVWLGLQAFIYLPITFWYQPETPLLRPIAASLFVIGFLLLLIRDRDNRFLLLALWILTFGLIGGFSESTPAAQRYVAAAPVCALFIGYGLSELSSILEKLWPRLRHVFYGVVIAVAIAIAVDELNFYFYVYTPKSVATLSHSNALIAQNLADLLKEKPSDVQVVFMGWPSMGYYSIPSLQFLVPDIKGVDATLPWEAFDKSAITETNLLFVFLPGNEGALDPIRMEYPGGQMHIELATDRKPLFWTYEYTSK